MGFLRGKVPAFIVMVCIIVMFVGAFVLTLLFNSRIVPYAAPAGIINGEYSVDGGPWIKTDIETLIDDHFRKIVIRGKPEKYYYFYDEVEISCKNVWFTIKSDEGELLYTNTFRKKGSEAWNLKFEADTDDASQFIYDYFLESMPMAMNMPSTPGYDLCFLDNEFFTRFEDKEIEMEVENPYNEDYRLSNCVTYTVSDGNGGYIRILRETLGSSAVLILLCVFGIFLLPVLSFVLGKKDFKYLTFGFLCFFWGVYMIMRHQSWFLNEYISDPVLCMTVDRLTMYFFFASLLVYFWSNLKQDISRVISGVIMLGYLLTVVVTVVLQFTFVCDLIASSPAVDLIMAAAIIILAVLLAKEARKDKAALLYLISWIPMVVTLLIDLADQIFSIPGENYFLYGFSLTLAAQVVKLVLDLRRQYRATILYHQMQRELYEARVAVMTSQIQPHFMYNALTSIAMMCTIDPPTAQEATVTFAKYLRGNMDSLKQNKPVPFEQELEHLKRYLYIEKLRFADKLNIEYDITAVDFMLPLLSVQPLVENAVKHGVGMKKKGGTVKISTRESETAYEVIVSDDGVGFDVSAPKADDGRSHVGMENTRTRLREMCDGEIKIESTVGEGTTATIILPKEGQKDEDTMS